MDEILIVLGSFLGALAGSLVLQLKLFRSEPSQPLEETPESLAELGQELAELEQELPEHQVHEGSRHLHEYNYVLRDGIWRCGVWLPDGKTCSRMRPKE